ncbi:MAG TPA: cytochrome-c oxidase, cbb3-type subunit III [Candidatus Acidoferrales bacterium]|nr:cytochrome-c oxidase, cbb3-type subunit III [Candidatus Acidoferrales bacterium]
MTSGWSIFVIILVVLNIVGFTWLLFWARRTRVPSSDGQQPLGHEFDGIKELNSPLPLWWVYLFIGTVLFSAGYLVLYPGLGSFAGVLGWTSTGEHDQDVAEAKAQFGPIYAAYAAKPITELIKDEGAQRIGQRLFANNCAQCHGSDARGGPGFPNLTDNDWKWGGEPETIEKTILDGRRAMMPAFAPALGSKEGVESVIAYVMSLSGRNVDPQLAEAGKTKFMQICIACHGPEGKGNPVIGAPNLTDNIWLYGGSHDAILEGLTKGRSGQMPAHRDILGVEKVHLVAGYVYGLSHRNVD